MKFQIIQSDISVLIFESHKIRVIQRKGEPAFVAKDICQALNIKDHKVAIRKLDEDEKGEYSIPSLNGGGSQTTKIITESGFYKLIMRSKNATIEGTQANRFMNWVCREVIPTIRQTGSYGVPFSELNRFELKLKDSEKRGHIAGVNLNLRKQEKHELEREKAQLIVKYQPTLF